MDVFLDTWPYGGHSTAIDMLWGGIPMVTFQQLRPASRVGASLLTSLGLGDLVATTIGEYEEVRRRCCGGWAAGLLT